MARPATGKTPLRAFRIPPEEWDPATAEAARRGETLTSAVRRFLRRYGAGDDPTSDQVSNDAPPPPAE